MHLGIGGHFDVKPVAGLRADEFDQFVGMVELARLGHARGQVAAQRDNPADAGGAVLGEHGADVLAGRTDAGQVRCGDMTFGLHLQHGFQGAVARRAAGAESAGEKRRLELRQLGTHRAQLHHAFQRLRREKLDGKFRFVQVRSFFPRIRADSSQETML